MTSGREKKRTIEVRFCGIGGMGVILASVILGKAAILEHKSAVQTQTYGAEQRGTRVKGDVIISEDEMIIYPVIEKPDILVAYSQEAFDYYRIDTKENTQFLVNSDLVKSPGTYKEIYEIPASAIARELKNEKALNMVLLGALIKKTAIISKESIINAISESISKQNREGSLRAFQRGIDYL
jgi:2-oxoglutarate ferredoxin oxidoreductase subunit gamma